MQTHPYRGRTVAKHQLVRDPQTQEDRGSGIRDPQHQGVTDGLDLRPTTRRQLRSHGRAEVGNDRCSLVVAMCLGQRRKARDVGEHERCACRLYGVHRHEIRDRRLRCESAAHAIATVHERRRRGHGEARPLGPHPGMDRRALDDGRPKQDDRRRAKRRAWRRSSLRREPTSYGPA